MVERHVRDAIGERWTVREERKGDEGFHLQFDHPAGRRLGLDSRLGVNALSDRQILDMIEELSGQADEPAGGEREARDPGGN